MREKSRNISEQEKEALRFLESDFNQCFHQMRHYDSQIFDILKFMFTGYTALIGVALGFYKFGVKKGIDFSLPISAALSVGLMLGLFMFILAVRNRVYFVQVARYINEQRSLFLRYKPLGFNNKSKMYIDHLQPPFFNWRSSQFWFMCIIASLNSTLSGVLLFILLSSYHRWKIALIGFLILYSIQLIFAVLYLKSRESKSASKAVFGEE